MVENELHFLNRAAFRQMAPAILQLEIRRLERLMRGRLEDPDRYNAFVKARYELGRFVAAVRQAEGPEGSGVAHLRAALLALSMAPADPDEAADAALQSIISRLTYVHDCMPMLYE